VSTTNSRLPSPVNDTAAINDERWASMCRSSIGVINVAALAAGVVLILDTQLAGRAWLAVLVFAFGPGTGLVHLFRNIDVTLQWALIPALSLACSLLTAQILLTTDSLGGAHGAIVLTSITAIGVLMRVIGYLRRRFVT